MNKPLVSVICLCHDQGKYVQQAIESVLKQTYEHIELIVIDDASKDNSQAVIENLSKIHGFHAHFNTKNLGNCKSFNTGFKLSQGKYLIDLAADDVLLPERVQIGVEQLEQAGPAYGVHFCDVEINDENGKRIGTHYKRDAHGQLLDTVPGGDIYKDLVERYLISAPSMMMSRQVLSDLNGYDEELTYEDFDFWVRSSRKYKYIFTDQILLKKMVLSNSLSSILYKKKNRHALSTAKVCEKILEMNSSEEENLALLKRINYELKWSLITENWEASDIFMKLKGKLGYTSFRYQLEKFILKMKPPWYPIWKMFK